MRSTSPEPQNRSVAAIPSASASRPPGAADTSAPATTAIKVGIFAGSLVSEMLGATILWLHARRSRGSG